MLIGAHYYAWYQKPKWQEKTLRGHLKQLPITQFENDWYKNTLTFPKSDPRHLATVRQHFEWCKQYGIDFLFVSCNNEELIPYLDLAEEIGIKLAIHVETLGVTGVRKVERRDLGKLVFHAARIKEWFNHPAWLRIDGLPAIAYYVTRQIADDCLGEAIAKLRSIFGKVYIFGDEVWWSTPKPERIRLFDAVYAYNMYINKGQKMDKGKVVNGGVIGEKYLELIEPYEKAFAEVAKTLNVKFAPTVLPGYNDRAVRYDQDHYVIPRENGEFFKQYLAYACRYLDKDGVLLVTSFNEWYEDSQIEPILQAPESYKPAETVLNLLQDTKAEAYGFQYLEALSAFKGKEVQQNVSAVVKEEKQISIPALQVKQTCPIEPVEDKQLLDECALLYYQTTVLPILETDNTAKQDIQKKYYACAERAHQRGFTTKQIKIRAKELTHFFKVNQDLLIKKILA